MSSKTNSAIDSKIASKRFFGTKAYCTCNNHQIWRIVQKPGKGTNTINLCGVCDRPSYMTWYESIALCPECMTAFSSPVEKECKNCSSSIPYYTWKSAALEKMNYEQ